MKNLFLLNKSVKNKNVFFETFKFLDESMDSVGEVWDDGVDYVKENIEGVSKFINKSYEYIKNYFFNKLDALNIKDSPIPTLKENLTAEGTLPENMKKMLLEYTVEKLLFKDNKPIDDLEPVLDFLGTEGIINDSDKIYYKNLAKSEDNPKLQKEVATVYENAKYVEFFVNVVEKKTGNNEEREYISWSARNLFKENITDKEQLNIFNEIAIKYDLPEESKTLLLNAFKIHNEGLTEKISIKFALARDEITEEEAQIQFNTHIQKKISDDPELSDYYSKFVKNSVTNTLYNSQTENKNKEEISREKISESVESVQKSGLNPNFIKGMDSEVDDEGNIVFPLKEIPVMKGITVDSILRVSPEGISTIETDFNEPHTFSNKQELVGIMKLIQYNAIISQIVNKRGGDNTELERKLSDNNLEEIITVFENIDYQGERKYEVFQRICENLFNKATSGQKKEFGRHLHNIFVGKNLGHDKSSKQSKNNIKKLVDEAVDSLKNGQESDASKDVKLGTGIQNETNSENS